MADVPTNISKMNDVEVAIEKTFGETYQNTRSGNINGMVDMYNEVHTSIYDVPGSYTFTVPELVTSIIVTGAGGGGGGRGASALNINVAGGSGGEFYQVRLFVTPFSELSVTVGSGGSAGIAGSPATTKAGNGGNSLFNGLVFNGGFGSQNNDPTVDTQMTTPFKKGSFSSNGGLVIDADGALQGSGDPTIYSSAGAGGQGGTLGVRGAGSGGGNSVGSGGNGVSQGIGSGNGGDGLRGGGGGGGGFDSTATARNGGRGGDGIIIIRW